MGQGHGKALPVDVFFMVAKEEPPWYGVYDIKGHAELYTKGGTPKKAVPPQGGAPHVIVFLI